MERQQPLVYRINVAMAHLGVSRTTIYRLVQSGQLKLVKIGARSSAITVDSMLTLIGKQNSETRAV